MAEQLSVAPGFAWGCWFTETLTEQTRSLTVWSDAESCQAGQDLMHEVYRTIGVDVGRGDAFDVITAVTPAADARAVRMIRWMAMEGAKVERLRKLAARAEGARLALPGFVGWCSVMDLGRRIGFAIELWAGFKEMRERGQSAGVRAVRLEGALEYAVVETGWEATVRVIVRGGIPSDGLEPLLEVANGGPATPVNEMASGDVEDSVPDEVGPAGTSKTWA